MADLNVPDHEIVLAHTEQDVQRCYDVVKGLF
jgi:hypothetical protein